MEVNMDVNEVEYLIDAIKGSVKAAKIYNNNSTVAAALTSIEEEVTQLEYALGIFS